MWDSIYTFLAWLDIAMALITNKVLDIGGQNSKVVEYISLPKLTAFLACEENLNELKVDLAA